MDEQKMLDGQVRQWETVGPLAGIIELTVLKTSRWGFQSQVASVVQLLIAVRLTQKACRLADAVKCDEHYGRVRADYDVLRVFVRTVDQRLCRHRAAQFDRQLMQLWNAIKHDLDGAACLVTNKCSVQCGHLAPHGTPHAIHGVPHGAPRAPTLPATAPLLPHDFRADNGRPHDVKPNYERFNEAFRGPLRRVYGGEVPMAGVR